MIEVLKVQGETGLYRAIKVDPESVPRTITDAAVDILEMHDHLYEDYAAALGGEQNIPEGQLAMLQGIMLCVGILQEMSEHVA